MQVSDGFLSIIKLVQASLPHYIMTESRRSLLQGSNALQNPYKENTVLHFTKHFLCEVFITVWAWEFPPVGVGRANRGLRRLPFPVVNCEPPGTPDHGYTTGQGPPYRAGDIVQFNCNPQFMMEGQPIIACQENGRWSGSVPKCKQLSR